MDGLRYQDAKFTSHRIRAVDTSLVSRATPMIAVSTTDCSHNTKTCSDFFFCQH